ncbi:MAG: D-alanyl-D-alanine carboxypeptidase/D-alanyl-D-alanine-endopeptidase [Planctomycetota bacterium]|nr:MAG: D-alanyl-D-alanine carboxypeptidase/D-alanyl-D-alanine-endopeptidase [Planctomycetota bacterium]
MLSRRGRTAFLALWLCLGWGAEVAAAQESRLERRLDGLIRPVDSERDIHVAVAIESLHGEEIFHHQADRLMVLASNTKLVTTAAALLALGPEYRWKTEAHLQGEELWIRGTGDPSLRVLADADPISEFADGLAQVLKAAGKSRLSKIWIDARAFGAENRPSFWPEDQWHQYYCAPSAALVLEAGCLVLELTEGDRRPRWRPQLLPSLEMDLRNNPRSGVLAAWWRTPDQALNVRGSLNRPMVTRLAVQEPVGIFARWLRRALQNRGIPVQKMELLLQPEKGPPRPKGKVFWQHRSHWNLKQAVTVANKHSDNFTSEMLLRSLAVEAGRIGTFHNGAERVREILAEADLNPDLYAIHDGSGMGRNAQGTVNRSTPAALCTLMQTMAATELGPIYFDSLPIGGQELRLAKRFRDDVFQPARVRAKTGWIRGASSLSGFLLAPDGTVLVFSIIVNYRKDGTPRTNNARFKTLQENILEEVLRSWPLS